jgi:uncharacterized membrane protein
MRGGRFSRLLAEAPIFAASYAALVFSFPGISFGVVNVRVADALMGFIPRLGWGPILGLAIGCLIVNFTSPIGLLDLFSVPVWTAGNIIILLLSRVRKWLGFIPSWLILTLWLSWLIGGFAGIPYPAMFMILAPQTFISSVILPIIVMYAFERFYPAVRRGRV